MKFEISKQIFEKYPEVEIGIVVVENASNKNNSEEIQNFIADIEKEIRKNIDAEKIIEIQEIKKLREIYQSFGAKPRDYRSSIESLIRRVINGKNLPSINPLVDIYNYISLKYIISAGGEDLDKLVGNLILDFAEGNEEFIALNSMKNDSPWKGEVIYKDDGGVICRCWNWREGDRTKITDETKNAILVLEEFNQKNNNFLSALNELKLLTEKYCGAKCKIKMLNKKKMEMKL